MAFSVPSMPTTARWRRYVAGPYPPGGPVTGATDIVCQLRFIKIGQELATVQSSQPVMLLLVAKTVPLRGNSAAGNGDLVEVPKGSGRWYEVLGEDSVALGFSNQYTAGVLAALNTIPNMWPY